MAEYIEREALYQDIKSSVVFSVRNAPSAEMRGANKIMDRIKCAPAADVVPVVHGRWVRYEGEDDCECSVCLHWFCVCKSGKNVTVKNAHYCPNCGAKMDLEG